MNYTQSQSKFQQRLFKEISEVNSKILLETKSTVLRKVKRLEVEESEEMVLLGIISHCKFL